MEKQLVETLSTKASASLSLTIWKSLPDAKISWFFQKAKQVPTVPRNIFERPLQRRSVDRVQNFSRAQAVSSDWVEATDWGCTLRVIEPMPSQLAYVGIRAHQLPK